MEQVQESSGHTIVKLTQAGIQHLAQAAPTNRDARSAHEKLVMLVAQSMGMEGRIVWTNLNLKAKVAIPEAEQATWRWAMPDVFSIRNTSRSQYLEPIVHEIKVSRADLLGDLKRPEKRVVGGQCWYVLGQDKKGRPIAKPDDIPTECGVSVRAKTGFAAHPIGTLPGDGPLCQLVFELNFKLGSIQVTFTVRFGDMKLASFFLGRICNGISCKRGGSEYEVKRFDRFQLALQGFKGVDRIAGCGNFQAGTGLYRLLKVITQQLVDVVD